MKKFTNIPELNSVSELKSLFNNHFDSTDLVLHYENDLSGDEFDDSGYATRTDDTVLVVRSMKELDSNTITEFATNFYLQTHLKYDIQQSLKGVVAVIGKEDIRDSFGRVIPADIATLLNDAEMRTPNRFLSWALYESLCVISHHPEAETE